MTPRLTIVMPMKGRRLFTFRVLRHANEARLPYRFLIADGQVDEAVAQRLADSRKTFPQLDVEYVRYPGDTDFGRFFAKMSDALQRVRTPYAMLADNDDFLGFSGIERALDFLDSHEDYVCARGHQVGFSVYAGIGASPGSISGKFNKVYMDDNAEDIDAPTAAERLRQGGLCHKLHYAVYRAAAPACILREIAEINFSDLMLYEDFFALRALTLGKARVSNKTITYYSQSGTGISYQPLRDWARHLLRSRFTSDAHALVNRIASVAAEGHAASAASIAEEVTEILECRYRDFLLMNYSLPEQIKGTMRRKWPHLMTYLQTRPRFSASRERQAVLSQLKHAGADRNDLDRIRDEFTAIEHAISPGAFADYATPFLPMARADGTRDWV
jgi:glycosyltransferase domain-containing protein